MDTRRLFQVISERMLTDFKASAEINHAGSKGSSREDHFREFLGHERLPARYGLGTGEIVSRIRDKTSGQCDVIIYDQLNGIALIYDKSTQVFPIDCVCGIVEVKSSLSKAELLDALEKIKTVKAMTPAEPIIHRSPGVIAPVSRPKPFGAVFAYSLADNSLGSLRENIVQWEKDNPADDWPNYVCVLGEGVIYHHGHPFETCIHSEHITKKAEPVSLNHREDSLFHFYCALHDMCVHMQLGPVELMRYYRPSAQIGRYVVDGAEGWKRVEGGREKSVCLTEHALDKIVAWCTSKGPIPYGEALVKRFGALPFGMDDSAFIKVPTFLFNPDNLPGLHELASKSPPAAALVDIAQQPNLASAAEIYIDRRLYVIPYASLAKDDVEEIE